MEITNPANRNRNRERRRRDRSRRQLIRTPKGIAASDRTITTPMTGDYTGRTARSEPAESFSSTPEASRAGTAAKRGSAAGVAEWLAPETAQFRSNRPDRRTDRIQVSRGSQWTSGRSRQRTSVSRNLAGSRERSGRRKRGTGAASSGPGPAVRRRTYGSLSPWRSPGSRAAASPPSL